MATQFVLRMSNEWWWSLVFSQANNYVNSATPKNTSCSTHSLARSSRSSSFSSLLFLTLELGSQCSPSSDRSIDQWITHSIKRNRSTDRSNNQSADRGVDPSASQSTKRSIDRGYKEKGCINHLADHQKEPSIDRSLSPPNHFTHRSIV